MNSLEDVLTKAVNTKGGIVLTMETEKRAHVIATQLNKLKKPREDGVLHGWEELKLMRRGPIKIWIGLPSLRSLGIIGVVDDAEDVGGGSVDADGGHGLNGSREGAARL